MRYLLTILLWGGVMTFGFTQISLDNASFEGEPQDATVPIGWHPCAPGSTPDILPGSWGVYTEPSEGDTYMGLITRREGSWESVGQRLSAPMKANECYNFSLDLAHSKTYANYNKPLKLKIWGGNTSCSKDILLGESEYIDHKDWKRYHFKLFATNMTVNYIIFEAQYMDGLYFHYNGNILIDNCSDFKKCKRAALDISEPINAF